MIGKALGKINPNWLFCIYFGMPGLLLPSPGLTTAAETSSSNNFALLQLEYVTMCMPGSPKNGGTFPYDARHIAQKVSTCPRVRSSTMAHRISRATSPRDLSNMSFAGRSTLTKPIALDTYLASSPTSRSPAKDGRKNIPVIFASWYSTVSTL